MKKAVMRNGFTLAEIMIALVVIGVITSILLPVAFNNVPNENIMKFKKGNATLAKVINELVSSDKYYKDGDLGIKADGDYVDSSTYFCKTFAEFVTLKALKCSEDKSANKEELVFVQIGDTDNFGETLVGGDFSSRKKKMDESCKTMANKVGEEIKTQDDIVFYQTAPSIHYGIEWGKSLKQTKGDNPLYDGESYKKRLFGGGHTTGEGFDRIYKIFCMDVDGINQGEDPFGYGIRADGKIVSGARADEWMEKSIQDKE